MISMYKENPLFSVLIASYNNGQYLEEAISSVYEQTYTNWEIIIVDDCSTDNSEQEYKKYSGDERIKIFFNSENKGCGYTKRRCVEEANGEICGFLDPDDKLVSQALEKMVNLHLEKPETSLIGSNAYRCDKDLNIESVYAKENISDIKFNDPYFFNFGGYIGHFATFKKEFYFKTEGIDVFLKRAVDQDLYLKLCEVGSVFIFDEPLYYYRFHDKGISTNSNMDSAFFWHWVVIMNAAKRRNVNVEESFLYHFVIRHKYNVLLTKYERVKKFEKINDFLAKVKGIFRK